MPLDPNNPAPTLQIIVAGTTNTGKSTIAAYITQLLRAEGLNVSVKDEGVEMTGATAEKLFAKLPDVMRALAECQMPILIQVQQLKKEPISYSEEASE